LSRALESWDRDGVLFFRICGFLSQDDVSAAEVAARRWVHHGGKYVIVDVDQDDAVLTPVFAVMAMCRALVYTKRGAAAVIARESSRMLQQLRITKLNRLFLVCNTIEEAVSRLRELRGGPHDQRH
jgi:hypothetical protein